MVRILDLGLGTEIGGCDGRGILAMLGYPGMCHFPGYTFCLKILEQNVNFEEKL